MMNPLMKQYEAYWRIPFQQANLCWVFTSRFIFFDPPKRGSPQPLKVATWGAIRNMPRGLRADTERRWHTM